MNRPKIIQYLYSNCFLLFIPVILFNIVFTKYLPEAYLKNSSHIIAPIENSIRIGLVALSTVLKIDTQDKGMKIGVLIYVMGLVTYCISFFILINCADAIVGKNVIFELSGYWTAIIWLIGIGLIGKRSFIKIPYHYTLYIVLSILFGIVHTYHGYILLTNP